MLALLLLAAQDAASRLETFRAALNEAGASLERQVTAFEGLAGPADPAVRDEAIKYVKKTRGTVRAAAARVLIDYPNDADATDVLLAALKAEKDLSARVGIAEVIAITCPNDDARKYAAVCDHPDSDVAAAALQGVEQVRSKELIEPLIRIVAFLEGVPEPQDENDYYRAKFQNLPEAQRRKQLCLAPAIGGLRSLTGQSLTKAEEWAAWWSASKSDFEVAQE